MANLYPIYILKSQEKIIQLLGSAEALERDLAQVLPVKEAAKKGSFWGNWKIFWGIFRFFFGEILDCWWMFVEKIFDDI